MIEVTGCDVEWIDFPSGEPHVRVKHVDPYDFVNVIFSYNPDVSRNIIKLMLIMDALSREKLRVALVFDYLPFARQDRVAVEGDAFALKAFANLVNSWKCDSVTLVDPHSDVAAALFDNVRIVPQHVVLSQFFERRNSSLGFENRNCYIVAPDAGAAKKAEILGAEYKWCLEVIQASKHRDAKTGELSRFDIDLMGVDYRYDIIIADDICDGGGTFIGLANRIREYGYSGKLILLVSHGLFTKGLHVLAEVFNEIWVRGIRRI